VVVFLYVDGYTTIQSKIKVYCCYLSLMLQCAYGGFHCV
jgi:hypothetical protein